LEFGVWSLDVANTANFYILPNSKHQMPKAFKKFININFLNNNGQNKNEVIYSCLNQKKFIMNQNLRNMN
jgi:hypothetical protein